MKTAARNLVCLDGTSGKHIECNQLTLMPSMQSRKISQLNEGRLPASLKGSNMDISTNTIEHFGTVAGIFDELGIGEIIDRASPKTRQHKASHSAIDH
jgi:hypothetical protein